MLSQELCIILNNKEIFLEESDFFRYEADDVEDTTVIFVPKITKDLQYQYKNYCDGTNLYRFIMEDNIRSVLCLLKNGQIYSLEKFFQNFGPVDDENFPSVCINWLADKNSEVIEPTTYTYIIEWPIEEWKANPYWISEGLWIDGKYSAMFNAMKSNKPSNVFEINEQFHLLDSKTHIEVRCCLCDQKLEVGKIYKVCTMSWTTNSYVILIVKNDEHGYWYITLVDSYNYTYVLRRKPDSYFQPHMRLSNIKEEIGIDLIEILKNYNLKYDRE